MKLHSGPQIGPLLGIRFQKCLLSRDPLWEYVWLAWTEWCEQKHEIISRLKMRDVTGKNLSELGKELLPVLHRFRWLALKVTPSSGPFGHVRGMQSLSLHEQPPWGTGNQNIHVNLPLRDRRLIKLCEMTNAGCDRKYSNGRSKVYFGGGRRRKRR